MYVNGSEEHDKYTMSNTNTAQRSVDTKMSKSSWLDWAWQKNSGLVSNWASLKKPDDSFFMLMLHEKQLGDM